MLIQSFYLSNMTKFIGYIYPLNHLGKGSHFFYSLKYSYFHFQSIYHTQLRTNTLVLRIKYQFSHLLQFPIKKSLNLLSDAP